MDAGILDTRIDILHLVSSRNEYGEQKDAYMKACSTKAKVVFNSGNKTDQNYETDYVYNRTFIVRSYVPVKNFDRIMYQDKMWSVMSIDEDRIMNQKTVVTQLVNE